MGDLITYKHDKKYKIKSDTLTRIQACVTYFCNELIESYLNNEFERDLKEIRFIVNHDIFGDIARLEVSFKFSSEQVESITTTLLNSSIDINEIHLKYFTLELIDEILRGQINEEKNLYTIRTYNRIFNSHPIRKEVLTQPSHRKNKKLKKS